MKITRICLLDVKKESDKILFDQLMKVFCSALHYSFNRLLEGEKPGELIKKIQRVFRLNKRFSEDAVMQAQAVIESQKELLPVRIEAVKSKIQKTLRKIEGYQIGKKTPKKVPLEICLKGLNNRLEQLREKETALLKHQDEKTLPKVIFGGKKNFYLRMKNKLSKDEWKDLRSNTLYSRGDKSKKGNLNTRVVVFNEEDEQFYLEVANPLLQEEGKNSPRITFNIHIPDKYFNEILDFIMPNQIGLNPKGKPIEEYQPYSIKIKSKNQKYYVHITYDLEVRGYELKWSEKIASDLVAGIDVNIDRIAVSVLTSQGNLLESRTFYCHEMEYVRSNRRTNIAGEMAKEIIEYLVSWNVGAFVLENIKLKQDHDTDHRFNRLVNSYAKNKIQKALISRRLKFGFKIKKVNPAYTSVIGRFKYSEMYGLSVHEAASFVIGRRGLDFEEKIPTELLEELRVLVKPYLIQTLGSMEESEKKSNSGKQIRKFLGRMLKNIETFKENHHWKLWNVIHKTLILKNHVIQLKEV
ncbi:IS200/IS605 family accessory protein TnpB-related protein [Bacillus sp. EB600]|uniref:IS200/IS605 family accessory protein TnpB-related protein n=1 Tax=Bacillus sp. EB600 TaxID=2806345 RepID=UPI00210A766E|nr:IS200/IS605 family accessory protein TnpB-related protein [Bacillus sp. EB600]MCQ6280897.1 IS200/IS605 family accessory protein TnpB-related protein [Bacillus sp. EB600]